VRARLRALPLALADHLVGDPPWTLPHAGRPSFIVRGVAAAVPGAVTPALPSGASGALDVIGAVGVVDAGSGGPSCSHPDRLTTATASSFVTALRLDMRGGRSPAGSVNSYSR